MKSNASTLFQDGRSVFVETVTTSMGPVYTSAKGISYFLQYEVEVNSDELTATFIVDSLFPGQLFIDAPGSPDVYEGIGNCDMYYGHSADKIVTGAVWIEQHLG